MTLRELREALSMTQVEVGRFCGVTSSAVSNWESGSSSPRPPQIRKLSELYKLSFDQVREAVRKSGGNPD